MTLDEQQRAILRLLCEGHTTDAIAHRLDLSGRTVRRRIIDLRDHLGCRSNTHLAVWAAVNHVVAVDVPPCETELMAVAAFARYLTTSKTRERATA